MTRKFFLENSTEIAARTLSDTKKYLATLPSGEFGILSGVAADGIRYYGISDLGTIVDNDEALDNFSSWWEPEWDSEVHEV